MISLAKRDLPPAADWERLTIASRDGDKSEIRYSEPAASIVTDVVEKWGHLKWKN